MVEALLFGTQVAPVTRTTGLPDAAQRQLDVYRQRERLFRESIPRPQNLDGPEGSLYFKRSTLER